MNAFRPLLLLLILFVLPPLPAQAPPAASTTVYHSPGKKRVHVDGCRRLPEDRSGYQKMTLGEAQAKGLPLCSRCPGSSTPGKGQAGAGNKLPESWVQPAPPRIPTQPFKPSPFAPLVSMGPDGRLRYQPFSTRGDRLLDWSKVGYMHSNLPLPSVPVREKLTPSLEAAIPFGSYAYPVGKDQRQEIQDALDRVAALPEDAQGIRGAVLLRKGRYSIHGPLHIPSGVVLRGEGSGEDGSILIGLSKKGGGDMIRIRGEGSPSPSGPDGKEQPLRIVDSYVATGSDTLTLEETHGLKAGDMIIVRKTVNQQWIDDLGMGERLRHIRGGKEGLKKKPWKPSSYQFRHFRRIEHVQGKQITLDLMLPQSLDPKHGGGEVYKVSAAGLSRQSGVESLRLISNYDRKVQDKSKESNFLNYRNGISLEHTQNSWVRDVAVLHVSLAAVRTQRYSRLVTVRDAKNLQPVGPKRGGNYYAFMVGGGSGHLFLNCYSEDGRHDFVGGSRCMGPFAFVYCKADRGGQSEPHHRWGCGFLYDNVSTPDGVLAAINRGDSGTGHGWAAANTLMWNCDAKSIVVFDPETEGENNFAIGFTGTVTPDYSSAGLTYANTRAGYWGTPQEGKFFAAPLMGSGHIESPKAPVSPRSLFTQQLIDRIGVEAAMQVLDMEQP